MSEILVMGPDRLFIYNCFYHVKIVKIYCCVLLHVQFVDC